MGQRTLFGDGLQEPENAQHVLVLCNAQCNLALHKAHERVLAEVVDEGGDTVVVGFRGSKVAVEHLLHVAVHLGVLSCTQATSSLTAFRTHTTTATAAAARAWGAPTLTSKGIRGGVACSDIDAVYVEREGNSTQEASIRRLANA